MRLPSLSVKTFVITVTSISLLIMITTAFEIIHDMAGESHVNKLGPTCVGRK
jgi:hypothetical protein